MSVSWNCSDCPAYLEAKQHDEDSQEWREFANLREALIWALLVTGYPPKSEWAINETNWETIYRRLWMIEKLSGAYRQSWKDEEITDHFFTPEEVRSMIGLRVNAGNKSDAEFMKWVKARWTETTDQRLERAK